MNTKDKNEILEWIRKGGKCFYQYGYTFKGATMRPISKEKAESMLKSYSFGMGFYELRWREKDGEDILLFNEFSENDML